MNDSRIVRALKEMESLGTHTVDMWSIWIQTSRMGHLIGAVSGDAGKRREQITRQAG